MIKYFGKSSDFPPENVSETNYPCPFAPETRLRPAAKAHCTVPSLQDKRGFFRHSRFKQPHPPNHPNIYVQMIPQNRSFVKKYIYIWRGVNAFICKEFRDIFSDLFHVFCQVETLIFKYLFTSEFNSLRPSFVTVIRLFFVHFPNSC